MTDDQLAALARSLSPSRLTTYGAHPDSIGDRVRGMELYGWNASLSAALMVPLHYCEVTVRNAVAEAIALTYGDDWPWQSQFELSLPAKTGRYKQRQDLIAARSSCSVGNTGKVIPELKFAFWIQMLTSRHDGRIWEPHLRTAFPNAPEELVIAMIRDQLKRDLYQIKSVRNRVAHHESILSRDHEDDYVCIQRVVSWRCVETWRWMNDQQTFTDVLLQKPC